MKYCVLFAVAIFLHTSSVSDGAIARPVPAKNDKCLRLGIPNILGIGTCLKPHSNLCKLKQNGLVEAVVRFLECLVNGLLKLDAPSQLYLLGQFLQVVLGRTAGAILNSDVVSLRQAADTFCVTAACYDAALSKRNSASYGLLTPLLDALCPILSAVTGLLGIHLGCNELHLNTRVLCDDNIKLKVPSTLHLAECAGDFATTCRKGKPVKEPNVEGLVRIVACLVTSVLKQGGTVDDLVCYIAKIPALLFGTDTSQVLALVDKLAGVLQENFGVRCKKIPPGPRAAAR